MKTKTTTAAEVIMLFASLLACAQGQEQTVNDEDIAVISFEDMNYPAVARSAHLEGVVVIRVRLDDTGKVVSATAVSGAKALVFDVMPNIQKWRFRPNAANAAVIIHEFRLATCHVGQRV